MNIIIDPGHGGNDPGAIGINGRKEKDIVLSTSYYLAGVLSHAFHKVYFTRINDATVSLWSRGDFAKKNKGNLFISLHCNGFEKSSANGFEVFYQTGDAISNSLAGAIQSVMKDHYKLKNRGVKNANFQVLRDTYKTMPAVLVEMGFITSPIDYPVISSLVGQWQCANYIGKGILNYIERGY